jgi:5-methyltetrahydropteroyltriglutamate--homocysteine methyltransferase
MLETTIAGSLPKPAWLAKPRMLWAPWELAGDELAEAKRDATLLALKEQEDAGIDIVTDGEQSRQHFVHGFLERIEGVDFSQRVTMGIRNNRYEALVPTVTGQLQRKGSVHSVRGRHRSRAHETAAEIHAARADDNRRHDRRRLLRRQGQAGDGVRRAAQ